MLAFELPPTEMIAVDYIGLSHQADVAEKQKDLLRQALSQILPSTKEIVDASEAPTAVQSSGIYLRCIQCDSKAESIPINVKVVGNEMNMSSSGKTAQMFKLLVLSSDKKQSTWNVELGPRKTFWFALPKLETLSPNSRLDKTNFLVRPCVEGISCPNTATFASKTECNQSLERYFGKRVDLVAAQALLKREKTITIEKLPFHSDVKGQSQVRALLSSGINSLTVKTQGRALKSGSLGDIILVEIKAPSFSAQKTRQFEARIIGEGEVEIVR
jgi:hypothetical protein